jgi:hypothetical protein
MLNNKKAKKNRTEEEKKMANSILNGTISMRRNGEINLRNFNRDMRCWDVAYPFLYGGKT